MLQRMNRRQAITALAGLMVSACNREADHMNETSALALLDEIADNLLRLSPEGATSLGIDTGARSSLRSQLSDRSAQGQQQITNQVRGDLQRVNAINTAGFSHATRTSFEVVRS